MYAVSQVENITETFVFVTFFIRKGTLLQMHRNIGKTVSIKVVFLFYRYLLFLDTFTDKNEL